MAFGVNYQDPNAQRAYGSPFDTANVAQQGVQNQMAEAQRQDQLMQFLRQFQMQLAQAREQSRQFERQYGLQKRGLRNEEQFMLPKLISTWSGVGSGIAKDVIGVLKAISGGSPSTAGASLASAATNGSVPQMQSGASLGGPSFDAAIDTLGGNSGQGVASFSAPQPHGFQAPAKLEPMFRKSMSYYDPSRREYVPGVPTDTVGSGASFSDDSALDMADDAIAKGMGADDIVRMVSRYMGGG